MFLLTAHSALVSRFLRQFIVGRRFYRAAWMGVKHGSLGMDALVRNSNMSLPSPVYSVYLVAGRPGGERGHGKIKTKNRGQKLSIPYMLWRISLAKSNQ